MLTDLDIYNDCDKSKPFVFKGTNRNDYDIYAIVIDDEIVNIELYKKSFIDLYNNYKFVETGFSDGKYTILSQLPLPSEVPATSFLRTFRTGVEAIFADYDRLPVSQVELESYGVDFSPSGSYSFVFYTVDSSLCYCNATSSYNLINSFTMTVAYAGYLDDITCKKNRNYSCRTR